MDEFISKVAAMRKAQKEWYRYHNRNDLKKALKLEAMVDQMLLQWKNLEPMKAQQKGLFQDDITDF